MESEEQQLEQIAVEFERHLRSALPSEIFSLWLRGLEPVGATRSALYVRAPDATREWVKRRFGPALAAAAAAVQPAFERVVLVASRDEVPQSAREVKPAGTTAGLKPAHTFDQFAIGKANRFAHAAALAVAELPGQAYNPLVLYGPPGSGKTHLLQAIGNYSALHDGTRRIRYETGESFTSRFTGALQQQLIEGFKKAVREAELLLVDDVEFLEGKPKTAAELLYTIDAALGAGAQVVLSSARHPSEMPLLEERLRERLQGGLIADLHPPEEGLRQIVLENEARRTGASSISPAVLRYLAGQTALNLHVLKGSLTRVVAYASLTGRELTVDLATEILGTLQQRELSEAARADHRTPSLSRIQSETAAALDIAQEHLISSRRDRDVVYARQVAMYLARELTSLSLPAIASRFGGRDHTTVLHAHRKIKALALTDPRTRSTISSVRSKLEERPQGTHSKQST